MLASVYDSNSDGKVDAADTADSVAWENVTGRPSTFSPATHQHSISDVSGLQDALGKLNDYYTKTEIDAMFGTFEAAAAAIIGEA